MARTLYIFSSGKLERKDNTLLLTLPNGRKTLPIEVISDIVVFGEIDLNKRVLEFLANNHIPIHLFNYYGYYVGTFYPREYLNSGIITLSQAKHFLDPNLRLYLAKSFLFGGLTNIVTNLDYYRRTKSSQIKVYIEDIKELIKTIDQQDSIAALMSIEGKSREIYYSAFEIFIENFDFEKRTRRPPHNPLNAMISFGNALLYTTVLSEIYNTYLDPRIGYLHETNTRRFTLNLDIAEVFKPVIVDRVIFSLINRGQIKEKHFEKDVGYAYLTDEGKKIFVEAFEEKLKSTISLKKLGKVSYRKLIRIECYKLYKHFLEEEFYKPFLANW